MTTVADAEEDALWGDREAQLVSWYDAAVEPTNGVRVSFLEPNSGKYRHVLLVYPYMGPSGTPTYEIVGRPQGDLYGVPG